MLNRVYEPYSKAEEYFILIEVRPQGDQSGAHQLLWEVAEALDTDATILSYNKVYEKHLKPITSQDPMKGFPVMWTMLCQRYHVARLFTLQKTKNQGSDKEEEKASAYSNGG